MEGIRPYGTRKPRKGAFSCELIGRRWITERTFEVELRRPSGFDFSSGQNISFHHKGVQRYYSLISTPSDRVLELCIQKIPGGVFTPFIAEAEVGSVFEITGPYGYFTFRPSERPPVFVATEIGVAPFLSFARSGVRGFILIHQALREEELYYRDVFQKAASAYVPLTADKKKGGPEDGELSPSDVIAYLSSRLPIRTYDFYLCGRQEMIRDVTLFADERFPGSMVFTEIFYRSE